ncbi:hypothetical protein, partial [Burkholderia sp. SIMBA_051]|uniref:hypothetical protein n=1 Tax=Burkholderia sp. SIMBA_051 TaxID=3085792 RepID=UPI0039792A9A
SMDPASSDGARATTSANAHSYADAALRWLPNAYTAASADDLSMLPGTSDTPSTGMTGEATGKLLVVDDNADLRDYMRRILSAAGHE